MEKKDEGFNELLDLLKTHPNLLEGVVFNPAKIRELLDGEEARKLALGVDVREFLHGVANPLEGPPITVCAGSTKALCKGSTRFQVQCLGGTTGGSRK